jgi:hypothetical protein
MLQQRPAGHRAEGDSETGDSRPDTDGDRLLLAVGEDHGQQRQSAGVDKRHGNAHRPASRDELADRLGLRGPEGGQRE